MSKLTMKPIPPVYMHRVGAVLLAVLVVILIYSKRDYYYDNFEQTSISLIGYFKENKLSALTTEHFEPDRYVQKKSVGFDLKKEVYNLLRPDTRQDDPRLINILRNYFIEQPSTEPYNLEHPDQLEFSAGQTPLVDSRLKYIVGSYFSIVDTYNNYVDIKFSAHNAFLE